MRASTINHINERIAHANQQHGRFHNFQHVMKCAINELNEAGIADCHLASRIETVKELLDAAVVCIRGAEQFGGLEGTEYDPADVALGNAVEPTGDQVAALAKVLCDSDSINVFSAGWDHTGLREEWCVMARAAYAHIGGDGKWLMYRDRCRSLESEVAKLRAELEEARRASVEAKRQRDIVASKLISQGVNARDLYSTGDGKAFGGWHFENGKIVPNGEPSGNTGELPERQTRPVKVRFDVTAEELFWEMDDDNLPYPIENVEGIALVQHAMDHLAAHAVLEVPPGVPSVEELAEMAEHTWLNGNGDNAERYRRMIVAIRDAILAAMPQPRAVTAKQVDAFAREMSGVRWLLDWETLTDPAKESFRADLRAAFEAAGFNVEGQSDAPKHNNQPQQGE